MTTTVAVLLFQWGFSALVPAQNCTRTFNQVPLCFCSTSQEILLGALKPFTRYELAVQSNGINMGGPFSGTVEESTLTDREYPRHTKPV